MAKRVDANQKVVVAALRRVGASVTTTHEVSKGFPDIAVGVSGLTLVGRFNRKEVLEALALIRGVKVIEGATLLLEIKDGKQPPSKKKLTPDEVIWHEGWIGSKAVVESETEALKVIGVIKQ